MSALPKPRTAKPNFTPSERTEIIVNEMLLLRQFPNHVQSEEFRRNVEYARQKLPALHAHAEILVRRQMAAEDHLLSHPEQCSRCGGAGIFSYFGRMRFCGCPVGDRAMKTEVLPDPEPARQAVTRKPLSPRKQLEQIHSIFDGGKTDDTAS
jgi:hypothetical protein